MVINIHNFQHQHQSVKAIFSGPLPTPQPYLLSPGPGHQCQYLDLDHPTLSYKAMNSYLSLLSVKAPPWTRISQMVTPLLVSVPIIISFNCLTANCARFSLALSPIRASIVRVTWSLLHPACYLLPSLDPFHLVPPQIHHLSCPTLNLNRLCFYQLFCSCDRYHRK